MGGCGLWYKLERRNIDRKAIADLEDPGVDEAIVLKWTPKIKRRCCWPHPSGTS